MVFEPLKRNLQGFSFAVDLKKSRAPFFMRFLYFPYLRREYVAISSDHSG